jgi:hypothetical protein
MPSPSPSPWHKEEMETRLYKEDASRFLRWPSHKRIVALSNREALAKARVSNEVSRCTATRTYADALGNFAKVQCKLFETHTGDHEFGPSDIPDVEATTDEQGLRLTFHLPLT